MQGEIYGAPVYAWAVLAQANTRRYVHPLEDPAWEAIGSTKTIILGYGPLPPSRPGLGSGSFSVWQGVTIDPGAVHPAGDGRRQGLVCPTVGIRCPRPVRE